MLTVQKNDYEAARILIGEFGLQDVNGMTALAHAIDVGNATIVKLLWPREHNIRIRGLTRLQYSVIKNQIQYVHMFSSQIGLFSEPGYNF